MAPTARDSASAGAWNFIQLAFVLSGACALAYEVLWGRWLAAVLGSSSTAACVVLASYMGGQAAGAALFGRWSARMLHPLRAYVAVEVAIGSSELRIVFDDVYNFLHAGFLARQPTGNTLPELSTMRPPASRRTAR
jgi:hypothetical protein